MGFFYVFMRIFALLFYVCSIEWFSDLTGFIVEVLILVKNDIINKDTLS